MSTQPAAYADDDDDIDPPRRIRSRNRLLDAAAALLTTGGIEAVTIDAVTKASKVARTTLYRHFASSSQLLAATFERLLPHVTTPTPDEGGSLRQRLIEILSRQAALFADAPPIQVTTLAWVALGPTDPAADGTADEDSPAGSLRSRVVEQYRKPFDEILSSDQAREELDEFDLELAECQLVGPLVFARMTGLCTISRDQCVRIVDDFLAAHSRTRTEA